MGGVTSRGETKPTGVPEPPMGVEEKIGLLIVVILVVASPEA
jgi:hypothetical protein